MNDRGAVLIEAAIVTPLLILLLFGIWTTARAWNIHNVLDHAAREAARYGAVDPTHAEILTIAQGEVIAASYPWGEVDVFCSAVINGVTVDSNDGTGTLCLASGTNPGNDPTTDDRVQVKLLINGYPLDFLFFQIDVDLKGQAVARLEP
ncbi:MAG: TadE family protein [Acidimicrobiia bacterium]